MKDGPVHQDDLLLEGQLREWKIEADLPPRFRQQVWQRIAREEAQRPAGLWNQFSGWINQAFARPSLAISYVTVLLLVGVAGGYWQSQAEKARTLETLGSRYVQMVDPYRSTHTDP